MTFRVVTKREAEAAARRNAELRLARQMRHCMGRASAEVGPQLVMGGPDSFAGRCPYPVMQDWPLEALLAHEDAA